MKEFRLILFLTVLLSAWQVNAAELIGAKLYLESPDGEMTIDIPQSGFEVADFTGYGEAPKLVVKKFEATSTGSVKNVMLHVALYKQGKTATDENWMEIPLSDNGSGLWSIEIGKDLAEEEAGKYVLEVYVTATDGDTGGDIYLNNGGNNYKIMYAVKGGGDEDNNVKWLKTGTAEIILYTEESYPQYRYNGDYTRDNTTMPGSLDLLGINFFSIYYDLAEGVEIVDASLQYMIYPEGEEGSGWTRIDCNELNTLVSSRNNTHKSTMNEPKLISRGLQPGNYVLRIMYQLIDQNGKYYFFGRENENGNFVFYFSVNEPKDPNITGISMTVTPTPGEQQYLWLEQGQHQDPFDLTNEEPLTSMTIDEVYIFAEGNFDYLNLSCVIRDEAGDVQYGEDIAVQLDDFGNWSDNEQHELLKSDILENGKTYTLEFWAEGSADGNSYKLDNDGDNYKVIFKFGSDELKKGDINGDTYVNTGDISKLYEVILGKNTDPTILERCKINADEDVNVGDVSALYQIILGK